MRSEYGVKSHRHSGQNSARNSVIGLSMPHRQDIMKVKIWMGLSIIGLFFDVGQWAAS